MKHLRRPAVRGSDVERNLFKLSGLWCSTWGCDPPWDGRYVNSFS